MSETLGEKYITCASRNPNSGENVAPPVEASPGAVNGNSSGRPAPTPEADTAKSFPASEDLLLAAVTIRPE
jgi:hypothetical protein